MGKNQNAVQVVVPDALDIVAQLHRRRISLNQLALKHGYTSGTPLQFALRKPYPKAEKIIADALETQPELLWPDRYENGLPNRTRKPMNEGLAA